VAQVGFRGVPEPLGIALIGLGYWGPNLARNFDALRDADLRWIVDSSAQVLSTASPVHVAGKINMLSSAWIGSAGSPLDSEPATEPDSTADTAAATAPVAAPRITARLVCLVIDLTLSDC
jgi:hypothetical protein